MWVASAPKYFEIGAEIFGTVGTRLPGDAKSSKQDLHCSTSIVMPGKTDCLRSS